MVILARCADSLVRELIASDIIQEEKAGLYAFGGSGVFVLSGSRNGHGSCSSGGWDCEE